MILNLVVISIIAQGPVDTRRHFNVYKTSICRRRHRMDVLETLKRRRVSTGEVYHHLLYDVCMQCSIVNIF